MTKPPPQSVIVLVFVLGAFLFATNASARPPTVMNSPGYERALQESRKQYQEAQPSQSLKPPLSSQKKTEHRGRQSKSDARH